MQSDREYKKGYEKSKTSFHTPVDMFSVVAAKKSQEVATNANYRNIIHTYNMLPDAMSFELAKNMMQLQSDVCDSHIICRAFTLIISKSYMTISNNILKILKEIMCHFPMKCFIF